MKKLLGILVLGLLWSSTSFAEDIVLKCDFDRWRDSSGTVNDQTSSVYIINLKKKSWGNNRGLKEKLLFNDDYFANYYLDDMDLMIRSAGKNWYILDFTEINRYDGAIVDRRAYIPVDVFKKFIKSMNKYNFKNFQKVKDLVIKYSRNPNPGWYVHSGFCKKSKKAF